MTIPAVILFSDAPAAHLSVGGLSLGTRHIRELHKCGVHVFYRNDVTTI